MTPLVVFLIGAAVGPLLQSMASRATLGHAPRDADTLIVASALGVVGAFIAALIAQALALEAHAMSITAVCAIVGAGIAASMTRRRWVTTP